MTVKGWLRAVMGLWAVVVAIGGLLTGHVAAIALGAGTLWFLVLQDEPVDEPVSEPVAEVASLDLREARWRGRA